MKVAIRDFPHRLRLDRAYLERMKNNMNGCPICGLHDSLKVDIDPECHVSIYCNYRIVCTNCGYQQKEWYETVAEAISAF